MTVTPICVLGVNRDTVRLQPKGLCATSRLWSAEQRTLKRVRGMQNLVNRLEKQSISSPRDTPTDHAEGTRRSARLNKIHNEHLRDSGTESDDDELGLLPSKDLPAFYTEPSVRRKFDFDTNSRDSLGESGVSGLTGDYESDDDSSIQGNRLESHLRPNFTDYAPLGASPMLMHPAFQPAHSPFPRMPLPPTSLQRPHPLLLNQSREHPRSTAEKRGRDEYRRQEQPIATRLRSNYDRPMITAARRTPVRVLYDRPYAFRGRSNQPTSSMGSRNLGEDPRLIGYRPSSFNPPSPKRVRKDQPRPSLDFNKMRETRYQRSPSPKEVPNVVELCL